jgi:hypothetical protein
MGTAVLMEDYKFFQSKLSKKYMEGIDRSYERISNSSEVFTLEEDVERELDKLDQIYFTDASLTVCDPCCGDGNYLAISLLRRIKNGIDFETALSTIYGVDLMADNVELCRERLLCGREDLKHIVELNIVCADALTYHYRFDGTDASVTNKDLHLRELGFEFS